MKSVFEEQSRDELADRVSRLDEQHKALWGKMNAAQMLRHCALWDEMIHQNKLYKRPLIGRLIGPMLLKKELQSADMRKNNPSVPELLVNDTDIDFAEEQQKLVTLLNNYSTYNYPDYTFIHPFFGKMTREQIGLFAYKHLNHHLQQFGV